MPEAARTRPLRADATRNLDSLIAAAQRCFRADGPDVSLQAIAADAGVGAATLFRHFAEKDELILAVLSWQVRVRVAPLIQRALHDPKPSRGLIYVTYGILSIASREANMMTAIRSRQDTLAGMAIPMIDSLYQLFRRAQAAGEVRSDLGLEDAQALLNMLLGAVESAPPGTQAWRRSAELLGDAIFLPVQQRPLRREDRLIRRPEVWGAQAQTRTR